MSCAESTRTMPTAKFTSRKLYIVVSSCPKCGAPIWAEDTNGTAVPENHFTCNCRNEVSLQAQPVPYIIYVKPQETTVPCVLYSPYVYPTTAPQGPTWICSHPNTAAPNQDPLKSPNICGSGSYSQPDNLKLTAVYNGDSAPKFHTTGVIHKVSDFGYK